MPILVMGASGNVGSELVRRLAERGHQVAAVSREPREWPAAVTGLVADPGEPGALDDAARQADGLYLMAGYAAEAGALAALPTRAPVVALSASSAPLGEEGNAMAAYHLATERAVQASGHPWTVLRPCSLQSNVLRWRDQLAAEDAVAAPFGDVPVAMVDPADVAAVAALALTEPGHAGRTYRLSGPRALTPPEQVAVLAATLGRRLRFVAQADDAVRDQMPGEYAGAVLGIFRGHPDLESDVQPTVPDVLGRPAGDLASYVGRHRDAF